MEKALPCTLLLHRIEATTLGGASSKWVYRVEIGEHESGERSGFRSMRREWREKRQASGCEILHCSAPRL